MSTRNSMQCNKRKEKQGDKEDKRVRSAGRDDAFLVLKQCIDRRDSAQSNHPQNIFVPLFVFTKCETPKDNNCLDLELGVLVVLGRYDVL